MQKISAATGWSWFKQGFTLFRRQPAELSTLFLSYMFLMLVTGVIPVAGQILPLLLVPVFSLAFLQASIQAQKGPRVYPNLLLTGFRSPAFKRLLLLGLLYMVAVAAAVGASILVDGGAFYALMTKTGGADPAAMARSNVGQGMLVAALVYLPAGMAFWYAAPLIAWQNMGVFKALFYSFFAVLRAGKAFIVYGLAWILMGVILPSIISTLVAVISGSAVVSLMVLLPISLILTAVLYCSFYPTYITVFGEKDAPARAPVSEPLPQVDAGKAGDDPGGDGRSDGDRDGGPDNTDNR